MARRSITASTYDNDRQAAFTVLRDAFTADVDASTGIDRSLWSDRGAALIERCAARLYGRSSIKNGKRSTSEGKRGNSRGDRRNSGGEWPKVEGERRAVRGERSNSHTKLATTRREGAAAEPLAVTSPGARNESELAGRRS